MIHLVSLCRPHFESIMATSVKVVYLQANSELHQERMGKGEREKERDAIFQWGERKQRAPAAMPKNTWYAVHTVNLSVAVIKRQYYVWCTVLVLLIFSTLNIKNCKCYKQSTLEGHWVMVCEIIDHLNCKAIVPIFKIIAHIPSRTLSAQDYCKKKNCWIY